MRKVNRFPLLILALFASAGIALSAPALAQDAGPGDGTDPSLVDLPPDSGSSQAPTPPDPGLLDPDSAASGAVGTSFEVPAGGSSSVTLSSSEPIHLMLEASPASVTMVIEAAAGAASTQITLGGLAPLTTYYKYEDDYHQLQQLATDANGIAAYVQDLGQPHLVFVQSTPSTIFLTDTGWSRAGVGDWDPLTRTATLTSDVTETIQIDADDVVLDGAGHVVTGSGSGAGIQITYRTGVTVRNVEVRSFAFGISLFYGGGHTVADSTSSDNTGHGIVLTGSGNVTLSGNSTLRNEDIGIRTYRSDDVVVANNVASDNGYGISIRDSSGNSLLGNTVSNNSKDGIQTRELNLDNLVEGNVVSGNGTAGYGVGLLAVQCPGIRVQGNAFLDHSGNGMLLTYSPGSAISDNTSLRNAVHGIEVYRSDDTSVTGNEVAFSQHAGIVIGAKFDGSFNHVLRDNTASDGEHGIIAYLNDSVLSGNVAVRNQGAGFIVEGFDDVLTGNVASTNGHDGISVQGERHSVTGSQSSANRYGIFVGSSDSLVSGNVLRDNDWCGVGLQGRLARNNTVRNNTASNSRYGIYVLESRSNQVLANEVAGNLYGLGLYLTDGNAIWNNDFLGNSVEVRAASIGFNVLNQPAPVGGNHWSSHTGPDADADGFVDVPFVAYDDYYGEAIDYLPLAAPYGGGADGEGPGVYGVAVTPSVAQVGAPVRLAAVVDDTGAGGSDVRSAEYSLAGGTWTPMNPEDGAWDDPTEAVAADLAAPQQPGVYELCVRGTDAADNVGEPGCALLVAYDPSAGFVTGGGWIHSGPGSYLPDSALQGKATFGFVARYQKGASTPSGNTQFRFHAASLDFHSEAYDWLVVTGADQARFKGTGTLNGVDGHRFMLWGGDGTGAAGEDTFRIRIWTEDEETGAETTVYDNGFDQALGGGSIVIHE